jgi:hypothetical protein
VSAGLRLSRAEAKDLQARIKRWRGDPVAFVLEVFGPGYEADTGKPLVLDPWQLKMLRGLARHQPHGACDGSAHPRVAAKACKGPGKTAVLAWIGWWRLTVCRHHRGAAVSITGGNLRANLWPELALWQRRSPLMMALFEHKGEVIESRDHPKTWWLQARSFPDDADKGKQAETLAGLHADCVTVLIDECGSIPQGVFDAALAIFNVAGVDGLLVAVGNATETDGALYRIWTEEAAHWLLIEITGDPDDPERSTRIDIDEARRQIAQRGRGDPVVMVNILGQFPPRGGNKLLGAEDVTAAMRRDCPRTIYEQEAIVWGLDVAAEGLDESVLYARQGQVAFRPHTWRGQLSDALADQVVFLFHEAIKEKREPQKIFVDKGGVGWGPYCRLVTLIGGDIVIGIDFGSTALESNQFYNRRTEIWCQMAEWVRTVGCLPDQPELRRDLTAPSIGLESSTSAGTRRSLESKKVMRKRGLPSTDHGDGLALTFAAPVLPRGMRESQERVHRASAQEFDPWASLGGRS